MRGRFFIVAALGMSAASARTPPPVNALPPAQVQQQVLALVNQARAQGRSCGAEHFAAAAPLTVSDRLYRAARDHARDMARGNYFEHEGRDGSTPKERVLRRGYHPRLTGENIAFGPDSVAEVVNGWLKSPGHCANLMDPRFRDMGVAVSLGHRRGYFYWVQDLGMPAQR